MTRGRLVSSRLAACMPRPFLSMTANISFNRLLVAETDHVVQRLAAQWG